MNNIGRELINLSVLLLECTHDESGAGLDLSSWRRLSLEDGIYPSRLNASAASPTHTATPKWESHTAHPLRAGAACAGEGVDSEEKHCLIVCLYKNNQSERSGNQRV